MIKTGSFKCRPSSTAVNSYLTVLRLHTLRLHILPGSEVNPAGESSIAFGFLTGFLSKILLPALKQLTVVVTTNAALPDSDSSSASDLSTWKGIDTTLCLPHLESVQHVHLRIYLWKGAYYPVASHAVSSLFPEFSKRDNADFRPLPFVTSVLFSIPITKYSLIPQRIRCSPFRLSSLWLYGTNMANRLLQGYNFRWTVPT